MFSPAPGGLDYAEDGALAFGAFRGPGTQAYRFAIDGATVRVAFADGRPFHALDLASGMACAEHICAPDLYRGRYRLLGPDRWTQGWIIEGPRKRQMLLSDFRRCI